MADRRSFLAGLAASGLMPASLWAAVGSPVFISAGQRANGTYILCGLDHQGNIGFQLPIPARGHAAAAHPNKAEVVAFARRPGTFALVIDCKTGREKARLHAPATRHFYGHGAFSADGHFLYTTENDFDSGAGVVGVWDTSDDYRRVHEFASGGVGPHDIKRMPSGQTFVIANGGIETHPDTGRVKLNIPTMQPNLCHVDAQGNVLDQIELPTPMRKNSIRHLAVGPNGTVAFAMQWQGDQSNHPPLLGLTQFGSETGPVFARNGASEGLQGYLGSIAIRGDRIAVTSPRTGVLRLFETEGLTLKSEIRMRDVCGVAASAKGFLASTGEGLIMAPNGATIRKQHNIRWDNHLIAI